MDIILAISDFIQTTQSTIAYFRIQDFFHGNKYMNQCIDNLNQLLSKRILSDNEVNALVSALKDIMQAQKDSDYILLSDLLELTVLPTMENVLAELVVSNDILLEIRSSQNYLADNLAALRRKDSALADQILTYSKQVSSSKTYCVECTNSGTPTLKYCSPAVSFYYHSNVSPSSEGTKLAQYYARPDIYQYTIFGFGFGYHIKAFLQADRRFTITVIETNIEVLTLAFMYCDLRDILLNRRCRLIYCNESQIASHIAGEDNSTLIIHYPSLRAVENESIRSHLQNYFINMSSMYAQKKYLDWNFFYNIRLNDEPAQKIMSVFTGKSVIYIGGGPSLEYYLDYISQNMDSKILLCASTAYRQLLTHSIVPHYVVMIDAQDNMVKHFKNTPPTSTALLYLSTACHEAVKNYSGKRYILLQKDYDEAEKCASANHLSLIETGGSVSTTVIDYLIRCQCRELITIGVDLAYTDNKAHAFVTKSSDCSHMIQVKSVENRLVPTTNVLNLYRRWIENRIKNVTDIQFTNLSHGAYIEGMENISQPTSFSNTPIT